MPGYGRRALATLANLHVHLSLDVILPSNVRHLASGILGNKEQKVRKLLVDETEGMSTFLGLGRSGGCAVAAGFPMTYCKSGWQTQGRPVRKAWVRTKLQALVYDILPSTIAVFSYAIGSQKIVS